MQQKAVKYFIIPLPQFSYKQWLIHFKKKIKFMWAICSTQVINLYWKKVILYWRKSM